MPKSPRQETLEYYDQQIEKMNALDPTGKATWELMRELGKIDLFFLSIHILGQDFANNDFFFERMREYEADPFGHFDGWARGHGKSLIITHDGTIQLILNNPELTMGIFSFNKAIARGFLRQLMREFEGNQRLKALYPEIFWTNPRKEAPKWSEQDGLILKRRGNPKEATIEAWGLTDGQPTSRHYSDITYDDVVSQDSVTSPEMIDKTTKSWELSLNLGSDRPGHTTRFRTAGTFYSHDDTYHVMLERGFCIPRLHPATDDGTPEGNPVFLTQDQLREKRKVMGTYTFQCQMLLDPKPDKNQTFQPQWLSYWTPIPVVGKRILVIDPAYSQEARSDDTAILDITLTIEKGRKVRKINDMIIDKLSQLDRAQLVVSLHRKNNYDAVFEEETGAASDKAYIEQYMDRVGYRFFITPLKHMGKNKGDRIKLLMPAFEEGTIHLPHTCMHRNYLGEETDMTKYFVDREYMRFPQKGAKDNALDALAYTEFSPLISGLYPADHENSRFRAPPSWDILRGERSRGESRPFDLRHE